MRSRVDFLPIQKNVMCEAGPNFFGAVDVGVGVDTNVDTENSDVSSFDGLAEG